MKSTKGKTKSTLGFLATFQNLVLHWGSPMRILVDHAGNQYSSDVMAYLRDMWIGFWNTEAYHQHHNTCERRWHTAQRLTNRMMDRTNAPPNTWFYALLLVLFILNHVCDPNLGNRNPMFLATGKVGDISPILQFFFNEPVYYKLHETFFSQTHSTVQYLYSP